MKTRCRQRRRHRLGAVVIDGDSFNDSATQIGGMTGENGSKIINVTRPTPTGRKSRLRRRCTNTPPKRDGQHRYYFTVVTSPTATKPKCGAICRKRRRRAFNGEAFKRPLLSAEIASGVTHGDTQYGKQRSVGNAYFEWRTTPAGAGYVPTPPICNRCMTPKSGVP